MVLCSSCGKEIEGNYCSNCGQHEPDFSKLVKSSIMQKRSNFWYLLPIFLGIIGGIIAYFVLRKSDSSKARNCLLIGIVMIIIFIVMSATLFFTTTDEQREKWAAQREADEAKALQEKIVKQEKEAELNRQEELAKQEELRIEQMEELPSSCDGVNSIEPGLYPTGEQCLELIDERIFAYCLSENNNDETKAYGCMGTVYALMDRNCKDSDDQGVLSVSYEVCMMTELVFAYQNLIPK